MTPEERATQLNAILTKDGDLMFTGRRIIEILTTEFQTVWNEAIEDSAKVVEHEESIEMELEDIAEAIRHLKRHEF